jgi:multiple sugar transport system permease protein
MRESLISTRVGLALLAPAMLLLALFLFFPFAWVVAVSFTNQTLLGANSVNPAFVGLENYQRILNFPDWFRPGEFGHALRLTAIFTLASGLGQVTLGFLIAYLFHARKGWLREVIFSLGTVCWILPEVPLVFGWVSFLDRDFGTLNAITAALGLGRPDWVLEKPMLAIILFNIWRGTAFSMLLFSSALASIPASYLETARVLGARPWMVLRDILLPLIAKHSGTTLLLVTLWTFNTFSPYLITKGGPAFATDLLSIFSYRVAFKELEFGRGAAIAVVMMLINSVLAGGYLISLRRSAGRK